MGKGGRGKGRGGGGRRCGRQHGRARHTSPATTHGPHVQGLQAMDHYLDGKDDGDTFNRVFYFANSDGYFAGLDNIDSLDKDLYFVSKANTPRLL